MLITHPYNKIIHEAKGLAQVPPSKQFCMNAVSAYIIQRQQLSICAASFSLICGSLVCNLNVVLVFFDTILSHKIKIVNTKK